MSTPAELVEAFLPHSPFVGHTDPGDRSGSTIGLSVDFVSVA